MQKLVVDTNVFISYLISDIGYCFKIVKEVLLAEKALHYLSNETFKEYNEVLNRTRFSRKYYLFRDKSTVLLNNLVRISETVKPLTKVDIIKDESDNKFLEVAYAAYADYLITGNKLHFTFDTFYNTKIVSPKEYWENYKP